MSILISVIVPVYNVEKYIEKCMQSLLNQTYYNFEALIVDDGSRDKSIEIAKSLVGNDSRFVFLEKENGGQGTARNLGLDHANGDYISFLDSDDFYEPNMLEIVVNEVKDDESIDVLVFGINKVDEQGSLLKKMMGANSIVSTSDDVLLMNTLNRFSWNKVYSRETIIGFRFSTDIKTYEDVDLVYRILYGRKIKSINNCLYNYTQRSGSTVRSFPPSFIKDKVSILANAESFLVEKSIFKENEKDYNVFYLEEVFYKSLIHINKYSKNYKSDVHELSCRANRSLLSFENIRRFKSRQGVRAAILLSSFKVNEQLPYLIVRTNKHIKKSKKILKGKVSL
ncbi:glycosyltransferase family 2 protein [uncultured Psychrobacter sp.]|uniref:glycosyltransferase family 2 protein n=1 Tax=uncultured Psychrobacter sp. TaxID=259303 RepID=UPI0026172CC4|nr:glycosyltransferase family 2 protein [uncultured Psychrobacter sp.]